MTDTCPPPPNDRLDTVTYTPTPRNIAHARTHVAQLLTTWGHPELAGTAALITSELATNAILHGKLPDRLFRVETKRTAATIRISVTDPRGERLPTTRCPSPESITGRGLLIVRKLASRWAVDRLIVGKTVWAELDIPTPPNV